MNKKKKPVSAPSSKKGATAKKANFIIPFTTIGIISLAIISSLFNSSHQTSSGQQSLQQEHAELNLIDLPHPKKNSNTSVEEALSNRRSYRSYQNQPINFTDLSQLLWSAQGITAKWGGRTVTSAKSIYPLTVYVIAKQVTNLKMGLYKYLPGDLQPAHQISPIYQTDTKKIINDHTNFYSLQHAPLIIIVTTNSNKLDDYLEAGYVAQNLFLQAESLGLGMAIVRNFQPDTLETLKQALQIPSDETVIYFAPIGHLK